MSKRKRTPASEIVIEYEKVSDEERQKKMDYLKNGALTEPAFAAIPLDQPCCRGSLDIARSPGGYTLAGFRDKRMFCHRLFYQLFHKKTLPKDIYVRHKCKNKDCFEITHLEEGTHEDNQRDQVRDGTIGRLLDDSQAKAIYENSQGLSGPERAEEFGVSLQIIHSIDSGRGYNNVTGLEIVRPVSESISYWLDKIRVDQNVRLDVLERIRDRSQIIDETFNSIACRRWNGSSDRDGYSIMKFHNRRFRVHALAYVAFSETAIAKDNHVRHLCGNRWCIEGAHLEQGTLVDSSKDKSVQEKILTGEKNPSAALTETDVKQIYEQKGKTSIVKLAKQYKVSESTISSILSHKTWTHVTKLEKEVE
jgi:hypothetical protein